MINNAVLLESIGVPDGDYCYKVIEPIYRHTENGDKFVFGHKIKYCPFWYGFRPNGGCMLYGWDPCIGDACKTCGLLIPEDEPF